MPQVGGKFAPGLDRRQRPAIEGGTLGVGVEVAVGSKVIRCGRSKSQSFGQKCWRMHELDLLRSDLGDRVSKIRPKAYSFSIEGAFACSLAKEPPAIGTKISVLPSVLSGWLPHCKRRYDGLAWVGSSLVFGLFVQLLKGLLALMESASSVPICNAGYGAFDIRWGVPAPV